MNANPCRALPEELRSENGGPFGFVAIGRPGQDHDCCCHGVTVEQFLNKPENFGGTWLIDGGWGEPPGPIRVDWLNWSWQYRGYSAECRDPFLPTPIRAPVAWTPDQNGSIATKPGHAPESAREEHAKPDRIASRRVDQIIYGDSRLFALCNDGSIFQLASDGTRWLKLPAIPQP